MREYGWLCIYISNAITVESIVHTIISNSQSHKLDIDKFWNVENINKKSILPIHTYYIFDIG